MNADNRSLWWDWTLACGLGGAIGLGFGGMVASALFRLFDGAGFAIASSIVVFGLVAGPTLAFFQHRVLGRIFPYLRRGTWVAWTAGGCVVAWIATILLPVTSDSLLEGRSWIVLGIAAAPLVGVIGVLVGLGQAVALNEWASRAVLWAIATVIGWVAAAAFLWWVHGAVEELPVAAREAIGVLVYLVGGLLVGALTGWVAPTLVMRDAAAEQYTHDALGGIGSIDLSE
ncbi:MAG: hypothetical protein OEW30_03800 [Acidimicrobiia bacterium]|nr:hypothetical protein [Acidimicrobiia bacterium]MDH5292061.1 hypothetical protein [Acidimicrobiia bacterium]